MTNKCCTLNISSKLCLKNNLCFPLHLDLSVLSLINENKMSCNFNNFINYFVVKFSRNVQDALTFITGVGCRSSRF